MKVIASLPHIYHGEPIRALTLPMRSSGGRNSRTGRITVHHRGGGDKRVYRAVDYKRDLRNIPATLIRYEFDPNKTALLGLVAYDNGVLSYIVVPKGLKIGDRIISSCTAEIKVGNSVPIGIVPIGTFVHNLESRPGEGAIFGRSAGSAIQVLKRVGEKITVKFRSGEIRNINENCWATIGTLMDYNDITGTGAKKILGKAGVTRHLGRRPVVRGRAKNPVDHPHGGNTGGRPSTNPWGKLTKGKATRSWKHRPRDVVVMARVAKRGQSTKPRHSQTQKQETTIINENEN